jgi:hypothetical protein
MNSVFKYSVFALFAVGVGVVIAYGAEKFGFIDDKLTKICEEKILSNLKSPRSYTRIKVLSSEKLLTRESYRAYLDENIEWEIKYAAIQNIGYDFQKVAKEIQNKSDALLKEFDNKEIQPILMQKQFEYDSQNGFGATIKGETRCDYLKHSNFETKFNDLRVRIDGENSVSKAYRLLVELWLLKNK